MNGDSGADRAWIPRELLSVVHAMAHAPFGCTLVEAATGRLLEVNQTYQSMVGYTREQMLGMSWRDLTHPDDAPDNIRAVETLRTGSAMHLRQIKRYIRRDGSTLWADIFILPIVDAPEPRRFNIAFITDVSQESSLTQFMRLLSALPDGSAVAQAMALGMLAPYSPHAVGIYAIDTTAGLLRLTADVGLTESQRAAVDGLTLSSQHPLGDAAIHMRELRVPMPASSSSPSITTWCAAADPLHPCVMLTVPVISRGIAFGVLLIVVSEEHAISWDLHVILTSLAAAIVPWLQVWMSTRHINPPTVWIEETIALTARQISILLLVARDMTNRQIARELGFAESTIKTDLVAASKTLDAHGRHDVVTKARAAGFLS